MKSERSLILRLYLAYFVTIGKCTLESEHTTRCNAVNQVYAIGHFGRKKSKNLLSPLTFGL